MKWALLALALALGACDIRADGTPPRSWQGKYQGVWEGRNPAWTGTASASIEHDGGPIFRGVVEIFGDDDCLLRGPLRATIDARYVEGTLATATTTYAIALNTLAGHLVGTFETAGAPCAGREGSFDLLPR